MLETELAEEDSLDVDDHEELETLEALLVLTDELLDEFLDDHELDEVEVEVEAAGARTATASVLVPAILVAAAVVVGSR